MIQQVKTDPRLFLLDHPGKLILDEIQLAPELFYYLKMEIDHKGDYGMYLLSGSQAYHLMQHVSESMAGRIAIVNLAGLNLREIHGLTAPGVFVPSWERLVKRGRVNVSNADVWSFIYQGQYPRLHIENPNRDAWYAAYTATYIERDVRQLMNVVDTESFMKFFSSVAARSGELLNYASIAKDIGVSANTVKNWLNILQASGVIYLLPAWSGNHLKRALKTPKLYFLDTGLLAWLPRTISGLVTG